MELAETRNGLLYRVEHVEKKVESPAGELTILRDVSFSVEPGEALAVVQKEILMKHIIPGLTFVNDAHTVVENPDFSKLDALYAGRTVCYGDYHAHSC